MSAALSAAAASGATNAKPPDNTLTLVVGGQALTGWQSVRVTRGIDRVPADFDIVLTERYPGQAGEVVATPGQSCQVKLGSDVVLTGYIDRYAPSFSPRGHQVRVMGRGKCEDLVDCSVTPTAIQGMSITTSSLLVLATTLAAPYDINVESLTGDAVPVSALNAPGVPLTFNAVLTETPYEIIERVSRYVGVLAYDDPYGNLVLANVGTATMASGFQQGRNVEAAQVTYSMDQRYRTYLPTLMPINTWSEQGIGGITYPQATDLDARKGRELIIVSEQFGFSATLGQRRAQWEAARRAGRGQAVRLTCNSWRDSAGTLWQPNAYASVNLPALKLVTTQPWIIGEVTFRRDESGTHADLTLMPPGAFQPEPEIIMPPPWVLDTPPAGGGAAAGQPYTGPR